MKILALNWKLNPEAEREALSLAAYSDREGVIIFPPAVFLRRVSERTRKIETGAQNIFWEFSGAFTGETSPSMAKDAGARWALVGHSERRKYFGETNETVNRKIKAAEQAGLRVMLCVGEPWPVRKRGMKAAESFVRQQLRQGLSGVRRKPIIAYEPIWAISGGAANHPSDTPEDSARMAAFIKKTLSPKPYTLRPQVLYGGSVNSKNIAAFLKPKEVNGVLIGSAGLKKEELRKMFEISNIT